MAGTLSEMGFGGRRATTSIVNVHSSGGTQSAAVGVGNAVSAKEVLSGALTANTLATLLNITSGTGVVPLLSLAVKDATSRTARLRVTVDGVVVFDATSSAITSSAAGIYAAGGVSASGYLMPAEPITFLRSFKVEVASSLSETDKLGLLYMLHGG